MIANFAPPEARRHRCINIMGFVGFSLCLRLAVLAQSQHVTTLGGWLTAPRLIEFAQGGFNFGIVAVKNFGANVERPLQILAGLRVLVLR